MPDRLNDSVDAVASESVRWFDLLLEQASPDELARARSCGGDLGEASTVLAGKAFQLHSLLEESRRRTVELKVLNDVAGRLTALRDVDELLDEIVCQAHNLFDTDLAYLGLLSDAGDELVLAAVAGELSAELRNLHLPSETGIVGAVVATGSPQWTTSYFNEGRIKRSAESDVAAHAEGIRSLLGVPMKLYGNIIGVLMVGSRRQRPFTDDQVRLLTALSAHASIAIENARLFEQAASAARDLDATNRQLFAQREWLDRAAKLHDQLIGIAVTGGSVNDIVTEVATRLGITLAFIQHAESHVGLRDSSSTMWGSDQILLDADLVQIAEHRGTSRPFTRSVRGTDLTCIPVVVDDRHLGDFLVLESGDIGAGTIDEVRRAGLVVSVVIMTEQAISAATTRMHRTFLADLLARPELAADRVDSALLDFSKPHCVAAFAAGRKQNPLVTAIAAKLANDLGGVAAEYLDVTVLVIPREDASDIADKVRKALQSNRFPEEKPAVGVAGPAIGAVAISGAFHAARRTTEVLLAIDRPGSVATSAELGVYQFLMGRSGPDDAAQFVQRTIGPVIDYDAEKQTDLVATMEAFFTSGQRHRAAARALFIHSNTMYQRLERVAALLGDDWAGADRALEIQLSIRLRHILGRLTARTQAVP